MSANELLGLLGKSIRSAEIAAFFAKNGIKYPKKDAISASVCDDSFWIIDKKGGIEYLFGINPKNDLHKSLVARGDRKGIYIPILTNIHITEKAKIDFPLGISYATSEEEMRVRFGEPKIPPLGSLMWDLPIDKERDLEMRVIMGGKSKLIREIWLEIRKDNAVIDLYDPLRGETIETALKAKYAFTEGDDEIRPPWKIREKALSAMHIKRDLFFVKWAIDNEILNLGDAKKALINKARSGEIDMENFAREAFADRGYVALESFAPTYQDFVYYYINNLPPYYLYYHNDFSEAFAKDEEEELIAYSKISALELNAENQAIVNRIINDRLKEFQKAH